MDTGVCATGEDTSPLTKKNHVRKCVQILVNLGILVNQMGIQATCACLAMEVFVGYITVYAGLPDLSRTQTQNHALVASTPVHSVTRALQKARVVLEMYVLGLQVHAESTRAIVDAVG